MTESRAQAETGQVKPPGLVFRSALAPLLLFPQHVPQTADRAERPAIFICSQGLFKLARKILRSHCLSGRRRSRSEYCLDQLHGLSKQGFVHHMFLTHCSRGSQWSNLPFAAQLKLQAPAVSSLFRLAPQLQSTDFGELG